ncbi:AmmeMemoRadiSam system protein B [Prosthecochloris sp. HL-130-GSB]|uniref:AmmeMemoRadiSam system protein B n=1 Tax=Prosthecochloris sp. HL-130-GSB TaxID=1974213 RepID=UPI001E486FCF|nr:AmmeMemoRadiSam system protein B [Prosthecochloris sp. HL-130-GSB]
MLSGATTITVSVLHAGPSCRSGMPEPLWHLPPFSYSTERYANHQTMNMSELTRYPAVAESFYPSDEQELLNLVSSLLEQAPRPVQKEMRIKALLVPHAGYAFCGHIAAGAYKYLENLAAGTVFLMGNAHAYLFEGIALDSHEFWLSPFGKVPVNKEMAEKFIAAAPSLVHYLNIAHHSDHVLEVQLPFLQKTLQPGFSILPLLFGENKTVSAQQRAEKLIGQALGEKDLIIASSDLSHFPAYHDANVIDSKTLEYIVNLDVRGLQRHVRSTLKRKIPMKMHCSADRMPL